MNDFEQSLVRAIVWCVKHGGKVLICGNGGSAAQAQHFAGELMGRFAFDRPPLAAVALCDPAVMTCIANDYGYDEVFARQVRGLAGPEDIVVGLSTSGASESVRRALVAVGDPGFAYMVTGEGRGADAPGWQRWTTIEVPGDTTAAIQEATLALIHRVCGEVEAAMFGAEAKGAA